MLPKVVDFESSKLSSLLIPKLLSYPDKPTESTSLYLNNKQKAVKGLHHVYYLLTVTIICIFTESTH